MATVGMGTSSDPGSGISASSATRQTQIVERFADDVTKDEVAVLFQIIRLAKQAYVYIGLADDAKSSLQSMSMGMMAVTGSAPLSTVVLPSTSKTQNTDSESQQLAQMLCRRAGVPVLVSYNVPAGSVTDAVRSRIAGFAATCLMGS